MKRLMMACGAAVALAVPLALLPAANAAAPTTTLSPGRIERGPDVRIPHMEGTTVVDGSRRIKVRAQGAVLLGKVAPTAYVVWAFGSQAQRVLRVTPHGVRVLVPSSNLATAVLSSDGSRVAVEPVGDHTGTTVKVFSAKTGDLLRKRRFNFSAQLLDFGDRLILTGFPNRTVRTFWWNHRTNVTQRIVAKNTYFADTRTNRLAYTTFGPDGDCTVLAAISAPRKPIWRTCGDHEVRAISPDGSRIATGSPAGEGTNRMTIRTGNGRALAHFRVQSLEGRPAGFGPVAWETNRALLMLTRGPYKTATIRCTATSCNRASALTPTEWPE
ncbi:hypothetical protein [Nocardioides speluncae]|uniref:hypothetical protein n=1 Tax=Nocardioides speluncae TaxID=2670337 RepID=UPI0012B165CC|nr:hypothetical protein [Nocardioides speluncae]